MKKLIAIILTFVMLFGAFSVSSFATEPSVADYVESVEIENLDVFTVAYEYYFSTTYGGFGYANPSDCDTKVTVNYKDGTKVIVDYGYDFETDSYNTNIPMPDGEEYHLAIYQTYDAESEKVYLVARCEEITLLKEECTIKKVSFKDNFDNLYDEVSKYSGYLAEHIAWCFEYMFNPEVNDFMYYFELLFTGSAGLVRIIFDEISLFANYYLVV